MSDCLECPCCGDVGAEADDEGLFHDGQPLVCGCTGWVSCGDDDEEPYINAHECEVDHA